VSGLPFDRTPFEHELAGSLGAAVAGATPPPGLANAVKARAEGAPQVVTALAAVNAVAVPAALRARVASGVGAGAAVTAVVAPKPRFSLPGVPPLPVVLGLVVVAAAVTATVLYVATTDDGGSPAGRPAATVVAPLPSATAGSTSPSSSTGSTSSTTSSTSATSSTSTVSTTPTTSPPADEGGDGGVFVPPLTRPPLTRPPTTRPPTTRPPTTPRPPSPPPSPTTLPVVPPSPTTLPVVPPSPTTSPPPPTTTSTTSTTILIEPLPAPRVLGAVVCNPSGDDGCRAVIAHTRVQGAAGYVVDNPVAGRIPCSGDGDDVVCFAAFPNGAPSGCDTTLRAVDSEGRLGTPSASFCVVGGDD
jgi:hypothetical protein